MEFAHYKFFALFYFIYYSFFFLPFSKDNGMTLLYYESNKCSVQLALKNLISRG